MFGLVLGANENSCIIIVVRCTVYNMYTAVKLKFIIYIFLRLRRASIPVPVLHLKLFLFIIIPVPGIHVIKKTFPPLYFEF